MLNGPMDSEGRLHIVLVPGFVGFDSLGQLDYYADVTARFIEWQHLVGGRAVLHYFDNFPTASVEVRSQRLEKYLLKRVARGEIRPQDRLALVGHSTGGLDIRHTIQSLVRQSQSVTGVDGTTQVGHGQLLASIRRLVFMSVPHFGTNLADAGCELSATLQGFVGSAAAGILRDHGYIANLRRSLTSHLPETRSDLVRAVLDALDESDEEAQMTPARKAAAREARSQFALWLDHMSHDFSAIGDLRSARAALATSHSPAHATEETRRDEVRAFGAHGICTRSYATSVVPSKARRRALIDRLIPVLNRGAPLVDAGSAALERAADLWLLPLVSIPSKLAQLSGTAASLPLLALALHLDDALVFDLFQALCADSHGPFTRPQGASVARAGTDLFTLVPRSTKDVELGDSDGVVNTLSMCWPHDPARPDAHSLRFVHADHADVIGHYRRKDMTELAPIGRRYTSYDLFESEAPFGDAEFAALWRDAFDFCAS